MDHTTGTALDFLPGFTQLKYLIVQNTHDANLTLFKVQAKVPNLIGLKFKSLFPISFGTDLTTTPTPISRLRSLELELHDMLLLYVQHFTSPLPDCLATLKIILTDSSFDGNRLISSFSICCSSKPNW